MNTFILPKTVQIEQRENEHGQQTWHLVLDGEDFLYPTMPGSIKVEPVIYQDTDGVEKALPTSSWVTLTFLAASAPVEVPQEYYDQAKELNE